MRIDRLARSLSHLLEVIERLEAKGAFFRSLHDPIDTASPQRKFTLQVLGAAAEFERALIRERTKAGLASARAKGRLGGNPGLRTKDPAALRKVRFARQDGYMERLNETAQDWVPHVRRLLPDMAWEYVLRIINGPLPHDQRWTQSRLLRAVKAYVADWFLPAEVLGRAGRRETDDRLPAIVAAIKGADPEITLQAICDRLESMRERTPRGRTSWQPSSVRMLLERAEHLGLSWALMVGKPLCSLGPKLPESSPQLDENHVNIQQSLGVSSRGQKISRRVSASPVTIFIIINQCFI